jgi:hypothetical protein
MKQINVSLFSLLNNLDLPYIVNSDDIHNWFMVSLEGDMLTVISGAREGLSDLFWWWGNYV